jgi:hypothetical protein
MAWLIGPIIVVLLVYLAGFRKSALGLLVAVIVAGFLLYQHSEHVQEKAETRIAESEVVLANVAITPTLDSSYNLTGRITNQSETYRIDGVSFRVTMRDCQGKDKTTCVSVAEASTHVPITVPSQQAREFTGSLYFGSVRTKVKGTLSWDYEIIAISAKRQ